MAAWRAKAIDGNVSPIVLNTVYSNFSPGIDRPTNPDSRMASEYTDPDAPASSVRSKSKNAAPTTVGTVPSAVPAVGSGEAITPVNPGAQ